MKTNQSIKIHSGYKAIALATLVGVAAGCKESGQQSAVVVDIQRETSPKKVLVRDLQDGTEKVITFNTDMGFTKLLHIGDTVAIDANGMVSSGAQIKERAFDAFLTEEDIYNERAQPSLKVIRIDSLKQQIQKTK